MLLPIALPLAIVNPVFAAVIGGGALFFLMVGLIIFVSSEEEIVVSHDLEQRVPAEFKLVIIDEDMLDFFTNIAQFIEAIERESTLFQDLRDICTALNENREHRELKQMCFRVSDELNDSTAFFVKKKDRQPAYHSYVFEKWSEGSVRVHNCSKDTEQGWGIVEFSKIRDGLCLKLLECQVVYFG